MLFTLLVLNQYHSTLSNNNASFEKEIWSVNQNGFHTQGVIFLKPNFLTLLFFSYIPTLISVDTRVAFHKQPSIF